MSHPKKIEFLKDRAQMLAKARAFFAERGCLEVDCPQLTEGASVDAHIDLIPIFYNNHELRYLHSSPEYGMKRLLAEGIGDIYQLSHVFRDGECGKRHNPEFMMAEWYRLGFTFEQMIQETLDFVQLFVGKQPTRTLTYHEVFKNYANIDYLKASEEDLLNTLKTHGIEANSETIAEGKEALLNLILGTVVEPQLGQKELTVLAYYPASQAALAQTRLIEDEAVAERFEIYCKGYELANGYHELANAEEQNNRFIQANFERVRLGKNILPIDEKFLKALEKGLPDCCGVAVGIDRLMMLRHRVDNIADIMPFGWKDA